MSSTSWVLTIPAQPTDPGPPLEGAWLRDPEDPAFRHVSVTRREWVRTWPARRRDEAVAAFLAACTDYQECTLKWSPF